MFLSPSVDSGKLMAVGDQARRSVLLGHNGDFQHPQCDSQSDMDVSESFVYVNPRKTN